MPVQIKSNFHVVVVVVVSYSLLFIYLIYTTYNINNNIILYIFTKNIFLFFIDQTYYNNI